MEDNYYKTYYQKNKDKLIKYQKQYYQKNKKNIIESQKQYYIDNKDSINERNKQYRKSNKEKIIELKRKYRKENKDKISEYNKIYNKIRNKTPYGRAKNLINNYKQKDKKANRGECTLTPEWIVENIFSKPCHYCGETDWEKIGCDRIYNLKPHTPDNVVPCCQKCNTRRGRLSYEEFIMYMNKKVTE